MQDIDVLFHEEIYSEHLSTISGIKFTPREIDIIACLVSARGTSKIASFLSIALRTVVTHIRNIMLKLECNSREGIIDFIERSQKLPLLREYYSSLVTDITFKKSLKEVSKLKHGESPKCLVVYWENKKLKKALLHRLCSHLSQADIKANVQEYTLEQKLDIIGNQDHIHLFLIQKEIHDELPQELVEFSFIDLSKCKNYYVSAFEIIKKLRLSPALINIEATFEKQYKGIQTYPNPYKEVVQKRPETEKLHRIVHFFNKKSCYFLTACLFICLLASTLWLLRKNEIQDRISISPLSQNTAKEASLRSDLVIPTNTAFLNRPELMSQIESHFKTSQGIQVVALIGSGGAGKTTLARQYARQQTTNVIWEVNAEISESLRSSFENIAQNLARTPEDKTILRSLQEIDDSFEKEEKIIQFVRDRLKHYKEWVLIFDNVEKFTDIQKYFPRDPTTWGQGKIILTTRDDNMHNNAHIDKFVFIGELTPSQKFDLFTKIINHGDTHFLASNLLHIYKVRKTYTMLREMWL